MKYIKNRPYLLLLASSLIPLSLSAQFAATGTTTVSVTIGPEAAIQITNATSTLTEGSVFTNYTGTTNFTYKLRTTLLTGAANVQLKVTTDFTPTGGPSVATPPTAGDALTYTCSVTSPATSCTGTQTASTASSTSVATWGAGANSALAGNTGSVSWTLTNDPKYATGTYSATVTFTISAT